jgi:hypothetical protein
LTRIRPTHSPPGIRSWLPLVLALALVPAAWAAPVAFNVPSQPADAALMAFCRQADVELLFPFDELRAVRSQAVVGRYEPAEALGILLRGTGYAARRNESGKYVVVAETGSLRGRLRRPGGAGAGGVHVAIAELHRSAVTDPASPGARATRRWRSPTPG